ncbi:MAG: NAD(P)-binding domain-containing protein, partial [Fimbriimonadaceae bacterium]|nr:NAD(P)-binding domain-containing protein [Alphaproteobacteria bacterium]
MNDYAKSQQTPVIKTGIIGVGHLAGFLVEGITRAKDRYSVVLSPRNAEKSAALAAKFGARIADSNQDVVDRTQLVIVSVLPKLAEEVLGGLRFNASQTVLSTMAGIGHDDLVKWVGPAQAAICMMPGLANAIGLGPSILYPDNKTCAAFLETLGPIHIFTDRRSYETASVFGGFSGATFSFMGQIIDWFADHGVDPQTARDLVAQTLRGNAEAILQSKQPMGQIIDGIATRGGITELANATLAAHDNRAAWHAA